MTILQLQQLYYIRKTREADIDKSIKLVGVITGKTPEQVEAMPMSKFNKICGRINKAFSIIDKRLLSGKPAKIIRVGTRLYRVHYRIDRHPINAGRYVEVISFGSDIINNLHKIMASIVERIDWRGRPIPMDHRDIAMDMERADFEVAYHAAVFFYTLFTGSMNPIRPYLVREITRKGMTEVEAVQTLTTLSKTLDGFTMPGWSQNMKEYLSNRFGTSALSTS